MAFLCRLRLVRVGVSQLAAVLAISRKNDVAEAVDPPWSFFSVELVVDAVVVGWLELLGGELL